MTDDARNPNQASRLSIPLIFIIFLAVLQSCYWDNEEDLYPSAGSSCDTANVTYSQTIAPIMSQNCNGCHIPSAASGDVVTSTWVGLSAVANTGQLYDAINWTDGINNMPEGQPQLSGCDRAKINKWISDGSPDN